MNLRTSNWLALALGALLVFPSCNKEDDPYIDDTNPPSSTTGTLKVQFNAHYNGSPFAFFSDFYTVENYRLQIETMRMLATEFWTKNSTGDSMYLHEAFKYDFATGQTFFTVDMNAGNYDGLGFAIGVNSGKNHKDPSLYPATHALSYNVSTDMHWSWATGYIFAKYEGKADTSGTGTGPLDLFYAFHPGADTLFRTIPFMSKAYTITVGSTTTLTVDMNVARFLSATSDTIDLKNDNFTHTVDNLPLAVRFADLFMQAFTLP